MSQVVFTIAQNGDRYQIVMTIISGQYVIDTTDNIELAAEMAAQLTQAFAAAQNKKDNQDGQDNNGNN